MAKKISIWEPERAEFFLQTEALIEEQLIATRHGARIGSLIEPEPPVDPVPTSPPILLAAPMLSPIPSPPAIPTAPEQADQDQKSKKAKDTEVQRIVKNELSEMEKAPIRIDENPNPNPLEKIDDEYDLLVDDLAEIKILRDEEGETDVDPSEFVLV